MGSSRDRVLAVLEDRVSAWYGPDAWMRPDPAFVTRAWSVHVCPVVSTADGDVPLVVKIPTWDEAPTLAAALAAGPQAATRREVDALDEIVAMVRGAEDPFLTAVVPVAYVPEINAVVTECLDAVPLRSLLRPRRWSRPKGR